MPLSAPVMLLILTVSPDCAKKPWAWATKRPPSSTEGTASTVMAGCSGGLAAASGVPPDAEQAASIPAITMPATAPAQENDLPVNIGSPLMPQVTDLNAIARGVHRT